MDVGVFVVDSIVPGVVALYFVLRCEKEVEVVVEDDNIVRLEIAETGIVVIEVESTVGIMVVLYVVELDVAEEDNIAVVLDAGIPEKLVRMTDIFVSGVVILFVVVGWELKL